MKPKKSLVSMIASMTLLAAVAAQPVFGSGGEGGKEAGGGERVGNMLRDLVDSGTCVLMTGKTFVKKHAPENAAIVEGLAKTHWFFAQQLGKEIQKLRFCLVQGNLRGVETNDLEEYVYYKSPDAKLTAIRTQDDEVVIDADSFKQLNARSKGLLVVHEAMHGFISWEADKRNQKVRSIVKAISMAVSEPMEPEDFAIQLEHSEVNTFLKLDLLEPMKDDLRTLLSSEENDFDRTGPAARNLLRLLRREIEGFACHWPNGCDSTSRLENRVLGGFFDRFFSVQRLDKLRAPGIDEAMIRAFMSGDFAAFDSAIGRGAMPEMRFGFRDSGAMEVTSASYFVTRPGSAFFGSRLVAWAIRNGNLSGLQHLVDVAPEALNEASGGGQGWSISPLWQALSQKDSRIARILLSSPTLRLGGAIEFGGYGDNYPVEQSRSAIYAAIDLGDAEVLRLFLAHPDFPRHRQSAQFSESINLGFLRYDPATQTKSRVTPIQYAKSLKRDSLIPLLQAAGLK